MEFNREIVRDGAEEGRKRGRPLKDGARRRFLGVRLTDDEADMLSHLGIEFGLSPSEIMRKALRMYYNYMINRL